MTEYTEQEEPERAGSGEALEFQSLLVPQARLDLRILGALRRIIRAIDIYSKRLATDYGVTVPQLLCMLKIDELGSLTLKELSQAIHLNPSTVVGIVDRLEKNEIVQRVRSERDRRQVRLTLTEKGRDLVAKAPSPLQDRLASSIEGLPELEQLTIAASLEKIILLMEDNSPEEIGMRDIAQEPVLETGSDLQGPPSENE